MEKDDEIGDIDEILSHIGGAKSNGTFDAEFEEIMEKDSEDASQAATKDQLPEIIELEHQEVIDSVQEEPFVSESLPNGRTDEWKKKFFGEFS